MRRSEILDEKTRGECLYAIEFHNGLIKVGSAGSARLRLLQHFDVEGKAGLRMRRIYVRTVGVSRWRAEADLVGRCGRIGRCIRGREWFAGLSFGAATTLLRQVSRRWIVE